MLEEGVDCGGHRAVQLVANEFVLTPLPGYFSLTSTWPLAVPLCAPERSQKSGNERAGLPHARRRLYNWAASDRRQPNLKKCVLTKPQPSPEPPQKHRRRIVLSYYWVEVSSFLRILTLNWAKNASKAFSFMVCIKLLLIVDVLLYLKCK